MMYITPEKYIEYHSKTKTLDSLQIPQGAVILFDHSLFRMMTSRSLESKALLLNFFTKHPTRELYSGIVNRKSLWILLIDMGAPLLGFSLELLNSIGIKKVLVCTTAGGISACLEGGEIFFVRKAYSLNGLTRLYYRDRDCFSSSFHYSSCLQEIAKICTIHEFDSLSTDGFFRESYELIDRYAERAQLIEMEAASAFAIGEYNGMEIGVIGYISDLLREREWRCVSDTPKIGSVKHRLCDVVELIVSNL